MVKIPHQALMRQVLKSKQFQNVAHAAVQARVTAAKSELIEEFESHPVTREIAAGPDVEGSTVLPGGYGNMFSFLGFSRTRDPITPVKNELQKIRVLSRPIVTANLWQFIIRAPSNDDIEKVSPMDWETGRSWVNAVTKGLSGFSQYVFFRNKAVGRSGSGVQLKNPTSSRKGVAWTGTSYLFGMLGKFRKKVGR